MEVEKVNDSKNSCNNLANLLLLSLLLFIFTLIVYVLVQITTIVLTSLRSNELSKDPVRQFMYTDVFFPMIGVFAICFVVLALFYVCIKVNMSSSKFFLKTKIPTMYLTWFFLYYSEIYRIHFWVFYFIIIRINWSVTRYP